MQETQEPRKRMRSHGKVRNELSAREKFFLCAVCRDVAGAYFAAHPRPDYCSYRDHRAVHYKPSCWFRSNADSAVRQAMKRAKNHLLRLGYIWVDGEHDHTRLVSVTPEGFKPLEAIADITPATAEAIQAGHSFGGDRPDGMHAKCESCSNQSVSLVELGEVESLFLREVDMAGRINGCGYWDFQYFSVDRPHCLRCATVAIAYYRAFLAMEKFQTRVVGVVDE